MSDWLGYLDQISNKFDAGVEDLQHQVDTALDNLTSQPSNTTYLATYQSKLSEYNLYRNAQSNVVKVFKDIDAAVIQNFR
ncbi:type III secretion system needle complex protein [Chromobacterium amazonense]|uniref:type III secretion system needle complex protein n=1 Tax=Chromobacterium amazonense TaxID=1382803 RepID=UPI003F7B1F6A